MDAPSPSSRSTQTALAVCVLVLGLFTVYRLYVPSNSARPTEEAPRRQIDLNRADRNELLQIPGLGASSADAILAHRAERGRFESLDDLTHVHGIGPKTTEKVKPWLQLGPGNEEPVERLERKPLPPLTGKAAKIAASDAKIDVNSAGEGELMRLPGIGATLAGRIVQARPFANVDDLRRVKGIGSKTLESLRPFVIAASK